jgi:hypothetical protein
MSTLTGQQIKDTYDGLLNLQDSTTGITNSFQAIQDGLGNDTGLRIKQNGLFGGGVTSYNVVQSQFFGNGYQPTAGVQYSAGMQNTIIATPFYDNGLFSYSAITTYTGQITTTSDTLEYAIYSSQIINPFGLYPYQQIVSGLTASTTSTGAKTFVLPSTLSFSGTGAGIYFIVYKVSNGGVQPTYRPGPTGSSLITSNGAFASVGLVLSLAGNYGATMIRANNGGNSFLNFSGLSTFDTTYSTTINTLQSTSTTLAGNPLGMLLHTIGV